MCSVHCCECHWAPTRHLHENQITIVLWAPAIAANEKNDIVGVAVDVLLAPPGALNITVIGIAPHSCSVTTICLLESKQVHTLVATQPLRNWFKKKVKNESSSYNMTQGCSCDTVALLLTQLTICMQFSNDETYWCSWTSKLNFDLGTRISISRYSAQCDFKFQI